MAEALQKVQQEDMKIKGICVWLAVARQAEVHVMLLSGTVLTYLQQWPALQLRDGLLHRR